MNVKDKMTVLGAKTEKWWVGKKNPHNETGIKRGASM